MTRLTMNGEFHGQIAFLTNSNQSNRATHTSCQASHNPATFINDPSQVNTPFFKHLPNNFTSIHATGFFIMAESEYDGALWAKTLLEQRLSSIHNTDQLVLMSSVPRPQMKPSTILPSNGGWVHSVGSAETTSW